MSDSHMLARLIISWLRRNASAESNPAKRAAFIEAHNAAMNIVEAHNAALKKIGEAS